MRFVVPVVALAFVAGIALSVWATEQTVKATGAALWIGVLAGMLWRDLINWHRRKVVGPLLKIGYVRKAERPSTYQALLILYAFLGLLFTWGAIFSTCAAIARCE
jgi:hypothetical protein